MTTKELGEIVKKTRKAQGLTQPQLAMVCGTGVRFIVDLEAGIGGTGGAFVACFVTCLFVCIDAGFGGTGGTETVDLNCFG